MAGKKQQTFQFGDLTARPSAASYNRGRLWDVYRDDFYCGRVAVYSTGEFTSSRGKAPVDYSTMQEAVEATCR